ncbi:MAG: sulfite exporter TauE/SafE family protein [Nitrospirota bacterium]
MFIGVLFTAFVATLLSSMSGAGAAILTTPIWLALGFPLPVVIATSQLNGAFWTPIAARNYLRGIPVDWALVGGMISFGLVGAYGGTVIVRYADAHLLQRIIGLIILMLVVIVWHNKSLGSSATEPRLSRLSTSSLAFPLGAYETFFGSGNGLFTSSLLSKTRGLPLLTSLGHYYILSFAWNCFAVYIYISSGYGDSNLMIPSTIGSVLGAYIGSHIGRKKGHGFVRVFFLVLGGILGLKLVLGL